MYDDGDTSDFTLTLHSDHVDGASSSDYDNDNDDIVDDNEIVK